MFAAAERDDDDNESWVSVEAALGERNIRRDRVFHPAAVRLGRSKSAVYGGLISSHDHIMVALTFMCCEKRFSYVNKL